MFQALLFLVNGSFQKRSILPPRRKFLPSGGGGEKKLFLIIVSVLGHPKGVGGLTSYFLRGGSMDVFWNDPLLIHLVFNSKYRTFNIICSLPQGKRAKLTTMCFPMNLSPILLNTMPHAGYIFPLENKNT
jgi:hypothetical protein